MLIEISNIQPLDLGVVVSIELRYPRLKNGSSFVNRNFKYAATGFGRGS